MNIIRNAIIEFNTIQCENNRHSGAELFAAKIKNARKKTDENRRPLLG